MRTLTQRISASIVAFDELPEDERELMLLAAAARLRAQAPYSGFLVGAAVRSGSGTAFVGCNVERVSYTQTTHAEQNAIDSMVAAEGPSRIVAVAVVAAPRGAAVRSGTGGIVIEGAACPGSVAQVGAPCGHCLQIIWENCRGDRGARIIVPASEGRAVVTTIGSALPMAFGPDALGIEP